MQFTGFPCSYLDDLRERLDLIYVDEIDRRIESPCHSHSLAVVLLYLLLIIELVRSSFRNLESEPVSFFADCAREGVGCRRLRSSRSCGTLACLGHRGLL